MLIDEDEKIDHFFMERKWNLHEREEIHNLSMGVLDVYLKCLSKHTDLPYKDVQHLANEMGFSSISAFIDTVFRVRNARTVSAESSANIKEILPIFFSDEMIEAPLGHSRRLRCKMANAISCIFSQKALFKSEQIEYKKVHLESINLPLAQEENFWNLYYNFKKMPFIILQLSRSFLTCFFSKINGSSVRIGYIRIDKKMLTQLPFIQWISLNINLDIFLEKCTIKDRYDLYHSLKDDFVSQVSILQGWGLVTGNKNPPKILFNLLLCLISIKSEPLICNKELLHKAIFYCKKEILKLKLKLLFSQGGWFRFDNAIIGVSGRMLGIPLMDFQAGGEGMYKEGGFGRLDLHYLIWGDMMRISNNPVTHTAVADPMLSSIPNHVGRNKKKCRIMYSPIGMSNIFSVENWLSASSYDILSHRSWVSELFLSVENIFLKSNASLYIKIKGFNYTLFQNHQESLLPVFEFNSLKEKYLIKKASYHYFDFMDIHVFCGPSTTFAQSMRANIPSICLWDMDIYQPKDEYLALFGELKNAGIIVTNSSEFESILQNRINTEDWLSEEVQGVRDKFCYYFAYTSKIWRNMNSHAIRKNLT